MCHFHGVQRVSKPRVDFERAAQWFVSQFVKVEKAESLKRRLLAHSRFAPRR